MVKNNVIMACYHVKALLIKTCEIVQNRLRMYLIKVYKGYDVVSDCCKQP